MEEDQVIQKSVDYADLNSRDPLQNFCLQQGYVDGYTDGYNQAIDDILLKISMNEIDGVTHLYPPEALLHVFKKYKIK